MNLTTTAVSAANPFSGGGGGGGGGSGGGGGGGDSGVGAFMNPTRAAQFTF
jgi:hypothetical protein